MIRSHRRIDSLVAGLGPNEALPDMRQKLIPDLTIGIEPLLAAAFDGGRVRRRPILDIDGAGAREFERAVVRFGRECDDEIEIESPPSR